MSARLQGSSLRDLVRQGYLGPFWCEGHEILRRIFVTVRDRRWGEVPPTNFECAIDEPAGIATLNARHTSDEVDFEWRGALKISENGRELRFSFEGKALRDMEVCRVGLVVLHPVEAMVDSSLAVRSPEGDQRLTVSGLISPQPIVNGLPQGMTEPFSGLVLERPDFGKLELRFAGDLFELEDQRNWGDASFKTYCTPLRLGFPRKVEAGASISQSLEAVFVPAQTRVQPALPKKVGRTRFLTIKRESPLLDVSKPADLTSLRSALASPSPTKVELRVELGTASEFSPELGALLSRYNERIERLLLYGPGTSLPSPQAIQRLRQKLESSDALNFPLVAATRGYFVEFNRGGKFEAPVTGVGFPLTATIHADDPETITENVAALVDIAETARHLTGVSEIVISPLALYHPRAAKESRFPKVLVRPWLAATLVQAALAGVTSITVAADLLEALDSGGVALMTSLLECAGSEVEPVHLPLPAGLHALTFVSMGSEPARMLVANLNYETASLTLDKRDVRVPPYGVMWIEQAR